MSNNGLKTLFNAVVNGALPATMITTVQTVVEDMFTVVKVVGETVTFKLADSLGGATFDLTWHLEEMQMENGWIYVKFWNAMPDSVKASIASFVQQNLPGGTFVNFLPDPELIKYICETLKSGGSIVLEKGGKSLSYAGKVFQMDGFLPTLAVSIIVKVVFRLAVDKKKTTWKKIGQDVATAVVSSGAVWATKLAIVSTVVHPPIAIVWVASVVVGAGCAKVVKMLIKAK